MAKTNTYYYDQLNKEQQRAYYAIKEGLLNLKEKRAYTSVNGPHAN